MVKEMTSIKSDHDTDSVTAVKFFLSLKTDTLSHQANEPATNTVDWEVAPL